MNIADLCPGCGLLIGTADTICPRCGYELAELQLCGHPKSVIACSGKPGDSVVTCYCRMCEEEAQKCAT